MLNSAEYEIFHANESKITNNCKYFLLKIAEHENFSASKYENANYFLAFSYLFAEKMSCSAEMGTKKVL